MKITKTKLRQIIKEEVESLTGEVPSYMQQQILLLLQAEPGLTTDDLKVSVGPDAEDLLKDLEKRGLIRPRWVVVEGH